MSAAPEHTADDGAVLRISDVTAVHGRGASRRTTLAPLSLTLTRGESVAVIGRSGAGKSTLADIVLGLRRPATGTVEVDDRPWCSPRLTPPRALRHLIQGVPQDPIGAFVPRWTIRRSMERAIAQLVGDGTRTTDRIAEAAERAHLEPGLLDHRPSQLSGGQAQRAAIARALCVAPTVLVADEPTSALDAPTAASVADALLEAVRESGTALLLVTHDPVFAARCTRQLTITSPLP